MTEIEDADTRRASAKNGTPASRSGVPRQPGNPAKQVRDHGATLFRDHNVELRRHVPLHQILPLSPLFKRKAAPQGTALATAEKKFCIK